MCLVIGMVGSRDIGRIIDRFRKAMKHPSRSKVHEIGFGQNLRSSSRVYEGGEPMSTICDRSGIWKW